jgi:hypothetical protein
VVEGRRIVANQLARIERLNALGCDTKEAEQTLDVFLKSLVIFEDDLRDLAGLAE